MATQAVTDLCKVILRDVYGEVAETIVGSLLEHGRLTAQQIAKHTDLSVSAVKGALVALVQNRFVLYWIDPATPKICHYSVNYKEIVHVLYTGSILEIISSKFGDSNSRAPEIVKNILVYGHVRAADYLEHANGDESIDEDEYDSDKTRNSLSRSMTDLAMKRYITPLFDFDFQPPADIYQQLYKNHYAKQARGQSENARVAAATSAATTERDTLFGSRDAPDAGLILLETKSQHGAVPKRVRRNQVGLMDPKYTVNPEAVFAVNHDRFLLSFRNDELAKLAAKTIGPVTAKVYRQLLQCYENKLFRCSQTVTQTADYFITTMSIMQGLDPTLDLKDTIVMPTYNGGKRKDIDGLDQNGMSKKSRTNTGGFIMDNGEDEEDDEDMDENENDYSGSKKISLVDVTRHLELLANSPYNFVIKAGNRGGGEWFVPFEELRETLKRVSYEQIIENKFGPLALRLFRIIKDKGMVNDELLARTALLRADTIARLTATLHDFGALDLQEVPRSNDRTPVKTFFLWFHSPQRAYGIVLQDMYKALSRMYKRILAERKEHPILLAKLDREDVKENEDLYLSAAEKQEIYELRSLEEKLLVQINRLQGLVRIFDDY
ncbi:hypothetical protein DV453_001444 [Geotrichum candidum]|nr:hypothetical protein DV453_001444 [Geotrichum candidum]